MGIVDFKFIIALLVLFEIGVHGYYGAKRDIHRPEGISKRARVERIFAFPMFLAAMTAIVLYLFSSLLDDFNAHFPVALRWVGVLIYFVGDCILVLGHLSLGDNWSLNPEIKNGHTLVTLGIYRWIRHPIYTAYIMMGLGFLLSSTNLLVGSIPLIPSAIICLVRIKPEEKMMLEKFGDEYKEYMQRTGSLLPRIKL